MKVGVILIAAGTAMLGCHSGNRVSGGREITDGDTLVFLVQSLSPSGTLSTAPSGFWNGAENLDTVRLAVLHRNDVVFDSVQVRVRGGPMVSLDSRTPELPAPDKIDSAGVWFLAPARLFSVTSESVPNIGSTILRFNASVVDHWMSTEHPDHSYITRLTVEIWSGGRRFARELTVQLPV